MKTDKEARRSELYGLLGDLPPGSQDVSSRKIAEEEHELYVLEKLLLDLNGTEPVPAYFVRPKRLEGRAPTILYNHASSTGGKEELIHGGKSPLTPYADELAKLGYCALCIDDWAFGERTGQTLDEITKEALWSGRVMWGMMVYDSLRAIDYLVSRPDVDVDRLGTLGKSLGSTMAWWVAALDTRIKVCVDICCLTDFQALIASRGLNGHGIYYYVPNLLKHFTTAQINALISPRAHLGLAGNFDSLTPPDGLDRIDAELTRVYTEDGAPDAWRLSRYNTGHMETAAMRAEIFSFLRCQFGEGK